MKFLLFPFSLIYGLLTSFRNHLYDIHYKKSFRFDTKVISVGNLTVGGTGKTPMIEYLIRLLADKYGVTTLSRGYGRKTHGFRIAGPNDTAVTIGDEPFQIYRKFSPKIDVAVGEDRALAIPRILFHKQDNELILLDDAFQHRAIDPDLNILLTDYHRPFFDDYVMPMGLLRERRKGAERADVVVVTKCPDKLTEKEKNLIINNIRKYAGTHTPVFFTSIKYMPPKCVFSHSQYEFSENVLLFSGIARSALLEDYVKNNYNLIKHIKFADHFSYSQKEIMKIIRSFDEIPNEKKCILTTEKDMVKLTSSVLSPLVGHLPLFYIPMETYFPDGNNKFEDMLGSYIETK